MTEHLGLAPWQKVAAKAYAHGDFADLIEDCEGQDQNAMRAMLGELSDGLFTFIMVEIARTEDCHDTEEAVCRLEVAVRDIYTVIAALEEVT